MKTNYATRSYPAQEDKAMTLYLKEIQRIPTVPEEEKGDLARRARGGDEEAMHRLVLGHLRFVVFVAKKYMNRGLPLSDLVNEGNIGLIKAVKKFDETRNFKFTTYAVWWIRQRMQQAVIENAHEIRLPMNKEILLQKLSRYMNDYWKTFHQEPTLAELTEVAGLPEGEVHNLLGLNNRFLSLDGPEDYDGENSLSDYLADPEIVPQDEELEDRNMRHEIRDVVKSLNDREGLVVRLYFGIGTDRSYNLEEIGNRMNLSRERVRQIKKKALEKLGNGSRGELLRAYV
ncbi:MAG: RNA polymerase sigma factor RpoD/SigA [Candidatus Eisenbacteria bacterium]|nr:RNA polymerase sigma factor RpoD/SigA [Candidatus Eisenbacteria bacterium]